MVMNRALFRRNLQEGMNTFFGLEYKKWPEEYRKFLYVDTSEKAYEEDGLMSGFGAAVVKPEGGAITYDSGQEAWVSRYVHETVALAFAITEEAEEDGLYGKLGAKYARELARSMQYTKEVKSADILNRAFNASYLGGDGLELCSTLHTLVGGGTFRNELATAADFSETSYEDALIDIAGFTDERGKPIMATANRIIVPRQLEFDVSRILDNPNRPDTANRDISATYKLGKLPGGVHLNHYLTDADAYFYITSVTDQGDGLKHFVRKKVSRGVEGDFETGNMRYKARERYVGGWSDPRGAYGSPGA